MKAVRILLPICFLALLAFTAPAAAPDRAVRPDKENVVAAKLEGKWTPDAELTKRLGGRGPGAVSVKSDPGVALKVPAKYDEFLKDKRIYMAGTLTLDATEYPFLLIEHSGGPYVLYFRAKDGDPMGDGESFHLSLAPAKETKNDLLFIGDDFNSAPFAAYVRAAQ